LLAALVLFAADIMAADPLADAEARFRALDSYRVTLRSLAADGERQEIRYAWRRPGWIRMDFVDPHGGTVMIYDPGSRRVRLSPFGIDHLPTLKLDPDNALIRSPRGHTVDRSDVGTLLANLSELRARGRMSAAADAEIAGRAAIVVDIEGAVGVSVAGVHRYRVWLAQDMLFPLKVQSYDANGELIESVDMSDAELGVVFPERFFTP
jgi:outer membrane lipoprotein-sorting protein